MRFITSSHKLSIEILRWARSSADYVPEAWSADYIPEARRLCRFRQSDVEDELHAFMICERSPELAARSVFRAEIDIIDPDLRLVSDPYVFVTPVLRRADTIERVAKYLHVLHTVFTSVPVIISLL
jgi:hypothetical protein